MNHDPKEHFSEAQITVITSIFETEMNRMLLKTVGAYVVTIGLGIMALGAGWYRLGNVEDGLNAVTAIVHEALPSKEYVDNNDRNLQVQIDGVSDRLDRIENKLDVILNKI